MYGPPALETSERRGLEHSEKHPGDQDVSESPGRKEKNKKDIDDETELDVERDAGLIEGEKVDNTDSVRQQSVAITDSVVSSLSERGLMSRTSDLSDEDNVSKLSRDSVKNDFSIRKSLEVREDTTKASIDRSVNVADQSSLDKLHFCVREKDRYIQIGQCCVVVELNINSELVDTLKREGQLTCKFDGFVIFSCKLYLQK